MVGGGGGQSAHSELGLRGSPSGAGAKKHVSGEAEGRVIWTGAAQGEVFLALQCVPVLGGKTAMQPILLQHAACFPSESDVATWQTEDAGALSFWACSATWASGGAKKHASCEDSRVIWSGASQGRVFLAHLSGRPIPHLRPARFPPRPANRLRGDMRDRGSRRAHILGPATPPPRPWLKPCCPPGTSANHRLLYRPVAPHAGETASRPHGQCGARRSGTMAPRAVLWCELGAPSYILAHHAGWCRHDPCGAGRPRQVRVRHGFMPLLDALRICDWLGCYGCAGLAAPSKDRTDHLARWRGARLAQGMSASRYGRSDEMSWLDIPAAHLINVAGWTRAPWPLRCDTLPTEWSRRHGTRDSLTWPRTACLVSLSGPRRGGGGR
jgi:hypothetical protein